MAATTHLSRSALLFLSRREGLRVETIFKIRLFRAARWRMEAQSSSLWTSIRASFLSFPRGRKPAF
jgi:hypothetical protein